MSRRRSLAAYAPLYSVMDGVVFADELRVENDGKSAVEAICRRCLATSPADRFPNVSELIAALNALQPD